MPPVLQDLPVVTFPNGEAWPVLGQGTWQMGERPERRDDEVAALRAGVDLGMTVIDTAESYGDGASEVLVAEALGCCRDELFVTTKVLPANATYGGVITACEGSRSHGIVCGVLRVGGAIRALHAPRLSLE